MIIWGDYTPYVPLHRGPLSGLETEQARAQHVHQLRSTPRRIAALLDLLRANQLDLEDSAESIGAFNRWYLRHIEATSGSGWRRTTPGWTGVSFDIGLYLGDKCVRDYGAEWTFVAEGDPGDFLHHRTVVSGFGLLKFCLTVLVMSYGLGTVNGVDVNPDEFNRLLRAV